MKGDDNVRSSRRAGKLALEFIGLGNRMTKMERYCGYYSARSLQHPTACGNGAGRCVSMRAAIDLSLSR